MRLVTVGLETCWNVFNEHFFESLQKISCIFLQPCEILNKLCADARMHAHSCTIKWAPFECVLMKRRYYTT